MSLINSSKLVNNCNILQYIKSSSYKLRKESKITISGYRLLADIHETDKITLLSTASPQVRSVMGQTSIRFGKHCITIL